MVECARIHVRKCDSKITEFYRKLKRKGKHENVAIIGAARKESHNVALPRIGVYHKVQKLKLHIKQAGFT